MDKLRMGDRAQARVGGRWTAPRAGMRLKGVYHFECFDADGSLAWSDTCQNIITNEGLDDVLDKYYKGSTYTAAHYVGLTDGTPSVAAGDTMSSHAGWSEVTAYSEAVRQTFTAGTVSSQSVDNSGSKASFSINGTTTVGGAFLSTNSTKAGSTGTLVSAVALTGGDQALSSGQTLDVTYTLTNADDGV